MTALPVQAIVDREGRLNLVDLPPGQPVRIVPLDETEYLLASPVNAARLLRAVRDAEAGRVEAHALDEDGAEG
jgi:hypothetical protein